MYLKQKYKPSKRAKIHFYILLQKSNILKVKRQSKNYALCQLCGKVNSLAIIFQIKTINKQNIRRLSTIYSQNVDNLCKHIKNLKNIFLHI